MYALIIIFLVLYIKRTDNSDVTTENRQFWFTENELPNNPSEYTNCAEEITEIVNHVLIPKQNPFLQSTTALSSHGHVSGIVLLFEYWLGLHF